MPRISSSGLLDASEISRVASKAAGGLVEIELQTDLVRGDLVTNSAFALAKARGEAPPSIAAAICEAVNHHLGEQVTAQAARPGFVNFFWTERQLAIHAQAVLRRRANEPISDLYQDQTVLVEYSQPNIAKPMHFGHLRSTVLGEALKRSYAALSARSIGLNHLGDWGSQFGKLLVAVKRWGNKEQLAAGGIHELLRLYVRFHEEAANEPSLEKHGAAEFAQLEAGDPTNRQLWQLMRDVSLKEFRTMYDRLGITMDEPELGESTYVLALPALIEGALARGVAEASDGAIVIPVGSDLPPCLIRKSDGATLYATRDLAAIAERMKRWQPDRILYVVAADQSLHFEQVFRAAERLGLTHRETLIHVPFGLVRLPEGKMSTRAGRVIFLEEVISEAVRRAKQVIVNQGRDIPPASVDRLAESVGIGALKYQDLRQHRLTPVVFDWEKMLALVGNTGPYLQYTHARTQSLLAKARGFKEGPIDVSGIGPTELVVIRRAIQLPEIVARVARDGAPNHLAEWLYELASTFNHFYQSHPVLASEASDRVRRLQLTALVERQIKRGLTLLGIEAPDKL